MQDLIYIFFISGANLVYL